MKIAVVGTGYVGLVTGTCFAETGNEVVCVDIDAKKVETMRNGEVPIYEPHLERELGSSADMMKTKGTPYQRPDPHGHSDATHAARRNCSMVTCCCATRSWSAAISCCWRAMISPCSKP